MAATHQESSPSLSTFKKWSSAFKRGNALSIADDPHSNGPVATFLNGNIKKWKKLCLKMPKGRLK